MRDNVHIGNLDVMYAVMVIRDVCMQEYGLCYLNHLHNRVCCFLLALFLVSLLFVWLLDIETVLLVRDRTERDVLHQE